MSTAKYDVGFKKPPRHTQFQPGQSGNPQGRPKGVKNLATDLEEELEQKILITEAQKSQQVTKQRALIKSLIAKALKGDTRAADVLIKLILGIEQAKIGQDDSDNLSEDDQAIIEKYLSNISKATKATGGKP